MISLTRIALLLVAMGTLLWVVVDEVDFNRTNDVYNLKLGVLCSESPLPGFRNHPPPLRCWGGFDERAGGQWEHRVLVARIEVQAAYGISALCSILALAYALFVRRLNGGFMLLQIAIIFILLPLVFGVTLDPMRSPSFNPVFSTLSIITIALAAEGAHLAARDPTL